MAANQINIDLILNDKDALTKLKGALGTVESTSKQATDSMNLNWAGFASKLFVAQQAIAPVIGFMKDAIKAAGEQADAINRLNLSLQNQGTYTELLSRKYVAMAESMAKSTLFADDAIMRVQQQLIALGNIGPENMQRVLKATLNLATQTGSLESAALLMSKAIQGNTSALSRYGIVLDENIPKGERTEAMLKLLEKRLDGMAESAAKAGTGPLIQLGKAFGELKETIGTAILESDLFKKSVDAVTRSIYSFIDAFNQLKERGKLGFAPFGLLGAVGAAITPDKPRPFEGPEYPPPGAAGGAGQGANMDPKVIQNQLVNDAIAQQESQLTQKVMSEQQSRVQARLASTNAEVAAEQKKTQINMALNDVSVKHDRTAKGAMLVASKVKFETELQIGQATAELMSSVATLSGKSSVKAIAIVVQAVVTAVTIMLTATNPLLAILRIATTAISAAAALNQLKQAEAALDSIKSEKIQPTVNVPGFAMGVNDFAGGLAVVGERGPELVRLPPGSDVIPNGKFAAGGASIHITLNNPVITNEESARSMAREIATYVSEFIDNEKRRI